MQGAYLANLRINKSEKDTFPFNLPLFHDGLNLDLDHPINIIVGNNGCGKSTLLEAIAFKSDFNVLGGGRNHYYQGKLQDNIKLAENMILSWHKKTTKGFFMRAENFINFASYIDEISKDDPSLLVAYGGNSLNRVSHGEAFLALFRNRFTDGLFILDEPEAALSPQNILVLLNIINDLIKTNKAQFIIATHSPMLMSFPRANLYEINGDHLDKVNYEQTEHFCLMKRFLDNPEKYYEFLFE